MKKNLKFLMLVTLTTTNMVPLLINNMATAVNIDINNQHHQGQNELNVANQNQQSSKYKGTYFDIIKDDSKFLPWQKLQIQNWTDYLLLPSSNKTAIPITKHFSNYATLKEQLKPKLNEVYEKLIASYENCCSEKTNSWYEQIKNFFSSSSGATSNLINEHNELSAADIIVFYYNFMTEYFPQTKDINEFVSSISFFSKIKNQKLKRIKEEEKTRESIGKTNLSYKFSCNVELDQIVLACNFDKIIEKDWNDGWIVSKHHAFVLTHELGHTFDYFDLINGKTYTNHNNNITEFLKLKSKSFGDFWWLNDDFYKLFSLSEYGQKNTAELFAESFTYWLLTPSNERTKAWDLWNEYFLDYLPQQRQDIIQTRTDVVYDLKNGEVVTITLS